MPWCRAAAARQRHDLVGRRVAADFVLEAARQRDRALAHALIDQRLHLRHFVRPGGALVVFAHHQLADGGMANGGEHVDRGRRGAQLRQVIRDRPRRAAVLADEQRGDALRHLAGGERFGEQAVGGVVVRVDEARGQHQAGRRRRPARPAPGVRAPTSAIRPFATRTRGRSRGRPGAVDQPRVGHDERGVPRLPICGAACMPPDAGRRSRHHRQDQP